LGATFLQTKGASGAGHLSGELRGTFNEQIGSSEMKNWLTQVTPLAAIASLALSGAARADFTCSNATLTGAYAIGVTNLTTPPQVIADIAVFDGNGHFTQRDYRGNSDPAEFATPGQETGTYTIYPDCTGSAVINFNVPDGGAEC